MTAHMPINEAERIRALESYNILDTGEDENFERIVRMARTALDTPIGLISFVDRKRQWFKSHQGFEPAETPRAQSFCAHAILDESVMVVEDATKDERFADNPLVTCENGIRFYAGAPLIAQDGHRVGTLCLIDNIPRRMDDRGKKLLKDMAAQVVTEMELRKIAGVDPLTGLYTRRMIDELARREFARGCRQAQPITNALLDADKFKSVNDRFGHPAGDAALRALGATIAPMLRAHDHLGRFGGERMRERLVEDATPYVVAEGLNGKGHGPDANFGERERKAESQETGRGAREFPRGRPISATYVGQRALITQPSRREFSIS
jgi:GAF domain-containing protein